MKLNLIYCIIGVVIFILDCSCKKDPIVSQNQNVIKNPSFESNGQPYYEFWYRGSQSLNDSAYLALAESQSIIYYSQDVPPRGGNWSLKLDAWPVDHIIETYITGQQGTNIYQLTVWMKNAQFFPNANNSKYDSGSIYLGLKLNNETIIEKSIQDTLTIWTKYTLIDTLTTNTIDTIVVGLSSDLACNAPGCWRYVLFDSVKLIKLR